MKRFKNVNLPLGLTLDKIIIAFINFISNRYPSADRLLRMATELGIQESVEAQIIVFSRFRDAIRQTSPRLYQSLEHREEVYMAIIEALEELEKILDEELEEEEGDEEWEEEEEESQNNL